VNQKKFAKLPKGLREFYGTLADMRWGRKVIPRLAELPESGLQREIDAYLSLVKSIDNLEEQVEQLKQRAARIGQQAFMFALDNWSVEEIQKATGYDND
jgi:hypothetical protein